MRKICFFTSTRADYGIMSRLMRRVSDEPECELQVIATNMHLSPEYGLTYREIEADGFHINKKVEMMLSSDTRNGIVKSMGVALLGFADALEDLKPDLAVILGDRYEMLAAAEACLIYKIPVAHIGGGDITEGAFDDSIRHCITKLSHFHFASTDESRSRIIQMGENPDVVFSFGGLANDNILHEPIMSKVELEKSLDFKLDKDFLLVTFHPVTLEDNTAAHQSAVLLKSLERYLDNFKIIFTMPNSDSDSRVIAEQIKSFVEKHNQDSIAVVSLGKKRYYSALKYCAAVIGNSSSGIYEAPSFHVPTLNIGDRQKGRLRGESVVDAEASLEGISKGLAKVLSNDFRQFVKAIHNPYEKPHTLEKMYEVIANYPLEGLIEKKFYHK